ncbi:hypothetical protein A8C32_04485 [Flavivirga aquatica]|uniref:Glycoside hydrolase family 16 n=1 Tax=Flavivirga aquatica TaxID=1849968 RepID=A0A1E5SH79_9FLAO|nr:carbohydrate-binding protein [Flavivirga aquatica]OEJ98477.1 hypothetical protein A8C32_04485 [Flavivirga aquatica]
MKTQYFFIATFCLVFLQAFSQTNLVWSDEFNGTGSPDPDKWEQMEYNRRQNSNGPDGWWDRDDVYLDGNGNLVIRVRKINNRNNDNDPYDYSVGAVRTKGIFEKKFGRFEIKCQLPTEQGWWVAFWMMQGNVGSIGNGGVDGMEVDIMEAWGWTDKINHAFHWDGYGSAHKVKGKESVVSGIRDGFHTYTLDWYPDKYIFYIDGVETWRNIGGGVCQFPGYIKVTGEISTENWAIGDNWSKNPATAQYPDYFIVDYVRVYDLDGITTTCNNIASIIEAENYDNMSGVKIENSSEGNKNVGYIDNNDWMEYCIEIPQNGDYKIDLRVASISNNGKFEIKIDGATDTSLNVQNTGGWQNWTTISSNKINIPSGKHTLRIYATKGGFNVNWLRVNSIDNASDTTLSVLKTELELSKTLVLQNPIKLGEYPMVLKNNLSIKDVNIFSINGVLLQKAKIINNRIDFRFLSRGVYFLTFNSIDTIQKNTKKIIIQ